MASIRFLIFRWYWIQRTTVCHSQAILSYSVILFNPTRQLDPRYWCCTSIWTPVSQIKYFRTNQHSPRRKRRELEPGFSGGKKQEATADHLEDASEPRGGPPIRLLVHHREESSGVKVRATERRFHILHHCPEEGAISGTGGQKMDEPVARSVNHPPSCAREEEQRRLCCGCWEVFAPLRTH